MPYISSSLQTLRVHVPTHRIQITHASSGVEKGLRSSNAMPVEVMGLMAGHVDVTDRRCIIVTDVRAARGFCSLSRPRASCWSSQ